jgi:hypothetical protein
MTNKTTLSHSAREKFKLCSYEYKLHYIEKLRSESIGSPLIFGTAIDEACEDFVINRNSSRAREIFRRTMKEQEINGELTQLQETTKINYLDNDFDHELLLESDNKLLAENSVFTTAKQAYDELKGKEERTELEKKIWNFIHWISLYRKGHLLVNAFMDFADENIEHVYATQPVVEFEDENGNKITGKADFIAKVKGHSKPVVLDLKTSGRYYDKNSVKDSDQLALYVAYFREFYPGMEKAGYVVLNKNIKKNRQKICNKCGHDNSGSNVKTCKNVIEGVRCNGDFTIEIFPEATVQFVFDKVPEEKIEAVIQEFNETMGAISEETYTQNWDSCIRFKKFKCPYYEFCRSGCMTGLIDKKKPIDKPENNILESKTQEIANG